MNTLERLLYCPLTPKEAAASKTTSRAATRSTKPKSKTTRKKKEAPETVGRSKIDLVGNAVPLGLLGLGGAAYGAGRAVGRVSNSFASQEELDRAKAGFQAMFEPLQPNTTLLTQYGASMNPALNIRPFGKDLTELLPAGRANEYLMGKKPIFDVAALRNAGVTEGDTRIHRILKRVGLGSTVANKLDAAGISPILQSGIASVGGPGISSFYAGDENIYNGARYHYKAFQQGPLAAVSHMMRGPRSPYPIENQELLDAVGRPITYNEYFTPKYEKFVQSQLGGTALPNEVDLKAVPLERQKKILQDFHASLSPAEQLEKSRIENDLMVGLRDGNTVNYRPIVTYADKAKQGMEAVKKLAVEKGVTLASGGAGGILANLLYRQMRDKKKQSRLEQMAASAGGMGAGAAIGHYAGTEAGRAAISNLLRKLKGG